MSEDDRLPAPVRTGSLAAAAGGIAVITLLARIVGFGRWFAFSSSVGATEVGNTYQSVNAVPNVLFEIAAGGVLAAVAVPLVAAALARGERRTADRTASALLSWALLVLTPLGLVIALTAAPVAEALLGGASAEAVALGAEMLRIFAVQVPLYGVAIVLAGVLQAHRRFLGAALAPLLSSLVVIATYLAYRAAVPRPDAGVSEIPASATTLLAVGTTLGVVALSLPLVIPVRRAGIVLRPTLRFPAGLGGRVRTLAAAGLAGVVGQQLATLVVIRIANERGGSGVINVFTYTQAFTLLPYAVLAVPIATAAFPALAGGRVGSEGRPEAGMAAGTAAGMAVVGDARVGVERTLKRAWAATLAAGAIGTALLVAVAEPVGRFFTAFDAGSRSETSVETLAAMGDAVTFMAPSLLALAAIGLLSRASYVHGHALLAGTTVGLGWLATTVLPLVVLAPGGAEGPRALRMISLGSSVGLLLAAVVLVVLVLRAWGGPALAVAPRTLAAIVIGPVVGALAGRVVATWLLDGTFLASTTLGGGLPGGGASGGGGLGAGILGAGILGPVGAGVVAGTVAVGLAALIALVLDPSVRSFVKRPFRSPGGPR